MLNNRQPDIEVLVSRVSSLVEGFQYQRIVLQVPKEMLAASFTMASLLKKKHPKAQFFVLYDSLKQSCCTDVLGAEHVNYDCLVHFGKACFSSRYQPNHHFIFSAADPTIEEKIREIFGLQETMAELKKRDIGYVVVDQKYYQMAKTAVFPKFKLQGVGIELLRLPMDVQSDDQYLIFGYSGQFSLQNLKNVLIISDQEQSQEGMTLAQHFAFSLKSLSKLVGQQLFTFNFQSKSVEELNINNNKLLMQRYSLISQLADLKVFGIIVSNTATTFHDRVLVRCQRLLKKHHKKAFTFMMNNLNEVKLGNFPEIEAYVIVSCYQHSLFGIKDFHKLVVTPNDLQVAFQGRPFDRYSFDCSQMGELFDAHEEQYVAEEKEKKEVEEETLQLDRLHNSQLCLRQKIQTLDFYRQRQFKGLQFDQKKEIKKASKGKIGLAQQYSNLI